MISFRCHQDAGIDIPMVLTIKTISGMWCHVVWQLCTDVSEKPPAPIILIDDGLHGVTQSKIYYWGDKIKGMRLEERVARTVEVLNEFSILLSQKT